MATEIPANRATFSLAEVVEATGGSLLDRSTPRGVSATTVVGVCTDSRKVASGSLYVALSGERFDGHAFVRDALAAGAAAVLVSDRASVPAGAPAVVVPDTLRALGALAAAHRRRWGGRIVAITGSAGKTTTKELAHAALAAAGCRVARTVGNLNNLVGVPMTLFCLDASVDLAVVEMGTSAPGEIARLAEIAEPDVGVVTSVSLAHTALLGSLGDVAHEKAALLRALPRSGAAVYHADDATLGGELRAVAAEQRLGFGESAGADVRLVDRSLVGERSVCRYAVAGLSAPLAVSLRLLGRAPAVDAAAALAIVLAVVGATALGAACKGLERVEPAPGRLVPRRGPNESLVLDDTYNANPASMRASIEAAAELAHARTGRLVLVLGDMLELGEHAVAAHAAVGAAAVEAGAAVLLTCGEHMQAAHDAAQAAGGVVDLRRCADRGALGAAVTPLVATLRKGDVVLVKGSRSMAMERAVTVLAGEGVA